MYCNLLRGTCLATIFIVLASSYVGPCFADDAKPSGLPDGFRLVYQQNFDNEPSVKEFQFSDNAAWRWSAEGKSGGCIELYQQSKYKTKHRSPFNLAMISKKRVGDFRLELDMKQTGKEYGHRDMCIYFGFQSPTQFYYTHLATAPDPNAHNIFIVNNAPRKNFLEVPKQGIDWGDNWKHIGVQRIGGQIKVYFENMSQPVFEGKHDTFGAGYVGFGSFDDVGKMDNVRLWALSSEDVAQTLFPSPTTVK